MQTKIYNQTGKETGEMNLPESVFGVAWNSDLVHQVVTSMLSNKRHPTAHAKDRSEVRGGGKKPWKQKGTGQARHGSTRSPIWVGGGVTHGPLAEKNYDRKVNRKMKAKALFVILSKKFSDGEILFVENMAFDKPKTTDGKIVLKKLSEIKGMDGILNKKKNAAYVALPAKDEMTEKSLRNFNNLKIDEMRNINPVDLMSHKYLIIVKPEEAIKFLEKKLES